MNFVKLTAAGRPLWVNMDLVIIMREYEGKTHLITDLRPPNRVDSTLVVDEPVNVIMQSL